MVDVNVEVGEILSAAECAVEYQYPTDFTKIPVITYYTLTEGMGMTADNDEIIQDASVQADIWCASAKECGALAVEVNSLMSAGGWNRQFSMDQKRADGENVYHKTMRFNKSVTL
ncbi:MAG: hypothetical protein LUD03_05190 [Firmicutes bacterium]|nr:hypothetical protein [Bacillota bacterium]